MLIQSGAAHRDRYTRKISRKKKKQNATINCDKVHWVECVLATSQLQPEKIHASETNEQTIYLANNHNHNHNALLTRICVNKNQRIDIERQLQRQ